MTKKIKKIKKRRFLVYLAVLIGFVLPLVLVIIGIVVFRITAPPLERIPEEKRVEIEGKLIPSQILLNKSKYHLKTITIRGKVGLAPVVCQQKDCPRDDPCCGCPSERNLVIDDPGRVLTREAKGQLRLLDSNGQPFCHRRQSSCEYDCLDWSKGTVYDVGGEFFASQPPPGWKLSLEYYFLVEDKVVVKRVTPGESAVNMLNEVKRKVQEFFGSGYYVLQ